MPSWSLQFEGKVFDGMEVIPMSDVNMQDKILDPDPWVCRSVVCLYVHRFEALWEFMVQYFFGEAQGVSGPSVSGRVVACSRLLLCSGLTPNWYLACMSIWVSKAPRWGGSSRSIYGPSCTGLLVRMFAWIVCSVRSRSVMVVKRYVWFLGRIFFWWNDRVVEFWQ